MGAFAGDGSVEAVLLSVPVERDHIIYQFDVVRLKGGLYAAGYADLLTSTRMGWHADLGVLLEFATGFSPPNVNSEKDVPTRIGETFVRHRALDAEREAGVVRPWPTHLLGRNNGHVIVDVVRLGWDDFAMRAHSALQPPTELARSRTPEPMLRAIQPFYLTKDREETRHALADVPRIMGEWRDARRHEALRRVAVA